jgi:hypothetical protein
MKTAFVGSGVALELARRSDSFGDCIAADAMEPRARRALRAGDRVLCVMDPQLAGIARELGCDVTAVDSLFWMWDRVPPEYLDADAYFVQNFPGVEERITECDGRPSIVGPIIGERVARGESSGMLVINLGGFESPFAEAGKDPYGELAIKSVATSLLGEAYRGRTLAIGGSACLRALDDELTAAGFDSGSLSPEAADRELARAGLVVTSPGLTTTLACFAAAVPTVFLPPQNYSQWLILATMRRLGLAPSALHWIDCDPDIPLRERMSEDVAVPEVRRAISRLAGSESVRAELRRRLSEALSLDFGELATRQHEWYRTLGSNGAEAVARYLADSHARHP